jgi:hypothetical protein
MGICVTYVLLRESPEQLDCAVQVPTVVSDILKNARQFMQNVGLPTFEPTNFATSRHWVCHGIVGKFHGPRWLKERCVFERLDHRTAPARIGVLIIPKKTGPYAAEQV